LAIQKNNICDDCLAAFCIAYFGAHFKIKLTGSRLGLRKLANDIKFIDGG
jgi:hypothetical protein